MAEDNNELDIGELAEMADAAFLADAKSIRDALPIAYVLDKAGIAVQETGSRLAFFCPFHNDENTPAGSVFGETLQNWSCWACGDERRGDVIELIQQLSALDGETIDFVQACDRARGLITQLNDESWTGPTKGAKRKELNIDTAQFLVTKAIENEDSRLIDELLTSKRRKDGQDSNRFSTEWLQQNFKVGVGPVRTRDGWRDEVVIPYYDADGHLVTYKHRTPETSALAPKAAWPADTYYNMWRTDMLDAPILLCEGESDTWNAQYEVGDTYRVLGLATGVSSRPAKLDMFKGHDVLIAFDGDGDVSTGTKGRGGAARWAGYLKAAGCTVRIVPLPEGKDVSSVAAGLRSLCEAARPVVIAPSGLIETDDGYRRKGETELQVSNFVFRPRRELRGDAGTAWEGLLQPGGQEVILTDTDMRNKGSMISWALSQKRAWFGSDRDVTILLGMIQAESVYLPMGHMTTIAGLHNNHFVWPHNQIGPDQWRYVPPPANVQLEDSMFIQPGTWRPDYIHTMRDIHKRNVTDPILAWMAAAPLRSLMKEFPILAISGPHGSGKTRTLETLLLGMTGTYNASTLTGTTPHAVISGFSATNAFPIVFEEYRMGARDDAKTVFEQLARDAYTQQKSQKGGLKGDWAALMNIIPAAPIVVSGEDMFSEGSHVERMIMIQMFRDGQNSKLFAEANGWRNNGLPYAYLTWLHRSLMDGTLDDLKIQPSGPGDLGPRQRINIGILHFGWRLLQMFMEDAEDSLDEPNFKAIESELREANTHTPIEDGINFCLEETEASGFVKVKDGEIFVRVENFVMFLNEKKRRGDLSITLPGRAPSIKKYLQMKYNAIEQVEKAGTLRQTWLVFSYDKIAR